MRGQLYQRELQNQIARQEKLKTTGQWEKSGIHCVVSRFTTTIVAVFSLLKVRQRSLGSDGTTFKQVLVRFNLNCVLPVVIQVVTKQFSRWHGQMSLGDDLSVTQNQCVQRKQTYLFCAYILQRFKSTL